MALLCLCIAIALLVVPAAAATTSVTVTRYCDNNYTAVDNSTTLTFQQLRNISEFQSNGDIRMQGLVTPDDWANSGLNPSDFQDGWDATESMNFKNYGAHNGTLVEDIVQHIGGMTDGSELEVADSTYPLATRHFSKTNVYTPPTGQGEMVLTWWDSVDGLVPNWGKGMRLYFYTSSDRDFSNMDMNTSFSSWYYQFADDKYSDFSGPSAKGLSVQTVDTINIYPPHRYDFATGSDTVEYAYEGGVTGLPTASNVPSATTVNTSKITAIDSDDDPYTTSVTGEYAAQRFVFTLNENATNIEKLNVTWIGTGTNAGGTNGADLYIWNGSSYEHLQGSTSSTEVSLTGEKTSSISNYVNGGNVTVLVKQKSTSDGFDASTLATDYVKFVVTHHH
ncbi:hypothetical protein RJ40_12050 [Methanofollis aquaemaris]|uniref:Uncharacterized protein n=1 Tax=Methanofollis aquaemaris TaxID=126734 RepID=A0A8A3S8C3_9EURY|nr:hypothetical protein [Methanofollis aquaemaris]QSZ68173.1 hypothetical protein RJ40_12050 [Methanofollis aquaemaris]